MKRRKLYLMLVGAMIGVLTFSNIQSISVHAEEEILIEEGAESVEESIEETIEVESTSEETEEIVEEEFATFGTELYSDYLIYTDADGNEFTYEERADGGITITYILSAGGSLIIPEEIDGKSVVEVGYQNGCIVSNPGIRIESLTVNCPIIGARAFQGMNIGTLIIGEDVTTFGTYSDSDLWIYWEQFKSATIDHVVFNATNVLIRSTGSSSTKHYGPFFNARIGDVTFGANVQVIPEFLFDSATLQMDTLAIHVPVIGAYAFHSSGVQIGTLILGEEVTEFSECSASSIAFHYWQQFSEANIQTLRLEAVQCRTTHFQTYSYTPSFYSPFMNAQIGTLEISAQVQEIPELFLMDASLSMDMLSLHVPTIGAYAFAGNKHSFGTLEIGSEVEHFGSSYISTNVSCLWNQFSHNTIGTLRFGAKNLSMSHTIAFSNICSFEGAFEQATISTLEIMDTVERIPDFFLYNAKITIPELTLTQPNIGAMSFKSPDISIGTLIIGETVEAFQYTEFSSDNMYYWEQFAGVSIEKLRFDSRHLSVETQQSIVYPNSAFYQSRIGELMVGEQVESIPDYLFYEVNLNQEKLELHVQSLGTGAFQSSSLSLGTLVVGKELETFVSRSNGSNDYMNQFANTTIGTLLYEAIQASTNVTCYQGPFYNATIGNLQIAPEVLALPDFLFYQAKMNLPSLTINTPKIGYRCFSGENVRFGTLVVGPDVSLFRCNSKGNCLTFSDCTIEKLQYNAIAADTDTDIINGYGPFGYNCVIEELEIGENVTAIPNGCFLAATLHATKLDLDGVAIGYGAFMNGEIHIEELTLGQNVTSLDIYKDQMNCFVKATIDKLYYNITAISPAWSTSTSAYGMFSGANVGELQIGDDVEQIPAFMFRGMVLNQETLVLPCAWSYYSFASTNITLKNLILNGNVDRVNALSNKNNGFQGNVIENVLYDITAATFDSDSYSTYGPFTGATITNFTIGERVTYLDNFLLRGISVTNFYVYPIKATESHLNQTFTSSYMAKCQNLYVHYNSDFKAYFAKNATNQSWLCLDYFDISYGDKVYDAENEVYIRELSQKCSVCGYEETGYEELDPSYNVYLSIPLEISLDFDKEKKAYVGSGEVYAYGTLGSAYEGVKITIPDTAETYGVVNKEGISYSIKEYYHPTFEGLGDTLTFTANALRNNQTNHDNGQTQELQTSNLQLSVDAIGLLNGGVGQYTIGVPLRLELY